MAAPALRNNGNTAGGSSSTSRTVNKPTGCVDNDILVAVIYLEADDDITAPAGGGTWTEIVTNDNNDSSVPFRLHVKWKRCSS